jgi:ElaB/YqjD/DUF883 family membrane-anchored ribosome-binding protein
MPMDQDADAIRRQMEETRASLAEKLETLEHQIVETVQGATSAVTATVENVKEAVHETVSEVKETVHETVDTVKSTFDLRQQVERHPWLLFAGAVAAGFLAERILERLLAPRIPGPGAVPGPATFQRPPTPGYQGNGDASNGNGHAGPQIGLASTEKRPQAETTAERREPSGLSAMFGDEIEQLKKTAIGTTMGLVGQLVTEAAPEPVRPDLSRIIDRVTMKLGGEPVTGPVLERSA